MRSIEALTAALSARRCSRTIRLAAVWSLVSAAVSSVASPSDCASAEERLFTCSTGKKTIAVCGSPGWTPNRGTVQYRFGPPGHAELILPRALSTPPASSALAGVLLYSGGGGAYLRFEGGEADYVVYTAASSSWGDKSGVAVEKHGKAIAHLACRGKVESKLGEALFRDAGFQRDPRPFDVP